MKIFHKIFQDKLITFFEMTDSFTDNFTDSIWSIIDQSGAKANNMLVGEILDEYVINHAVLDEFYLNTFNDILHIHANETLLRMMGEFEKVEKDEVHIRSSWLNVMKRGEFNPLHTHEKNDLNLVYFLNDFDSSIESSFGRNNKSRFFDLGTKTTSTDASYKGCHVIIRNNELMNILPRKNFGVIYDWDLIHTVYPFDKNEARLTFVMNIILGKTTNRFGEWEYTNLPHERGYD